MVLELLAERPAGSHDILQKLFSAEYENVFRREAKERSRADAARLMRSRYYNFLYKLQSEGLIVKKQEDDTVQFAISKKGIAKLVELKNRGSFPEKKEYQKDEGSGVAIVTFDIPESDRKKRDWLRGVLKHLGFTMIQKSVWVGKTRLPIALLRDLQKLKLLEHIEAFQVSKVGNLKKLSVTKT